MKKGIILAALPVVFLLTFAAGAPKDSGLTWRDIFSVINVVVPLVIGVIVFIWRRKQTAENEANALRLEALRKGAETYADNAIRDASSRLENKHTTATAQNDDMLRELSSAGATQNQALAHLKEYIDREVSLLQKCCDKIETKIESMNTELFGHQTLCGKNYVPYASYKEEMSTQRELVREVREIIRELAALKRSE